MDKEIDAAVKRCNAYQVHHTMSAKAPVYPWENTESP